MSRLRRFEEFRFIGTRDTMTVYDTDDEEQAALVRERAADDDLMGRQLIQTFGPDTLLEARNRSFHPVHER